jgi:hypothetical protein
MKQRLSIVLILCMLAACSTPSPHSVSASTPSPSHVSTIDQLAIVAGDEEPGMPSVDSGGKRAKNGALVGGGSGATTGAALSLTCGPFVAACMAILVPGMGGAGALGGGLYGITGLPKDEAAKVLAKLMDLRKTRDVNKELQDSIVAALPVGRLVPEDQAETLMIVAIDTIQLNKDSGNKLVLVIRAEARLESRDSDSTFFAKDKHAATRARHAKTRGESRAWDSKFSTTEKFYTSTSARLTIADWLDQTGRAFEIEMDRCIADIADQISKDLLLSAENGNT